MAVVRIVGLCLLVTLIVSGEQTNNLSNTTQMLTGILLKVILNFNHSIILFFSQKIKTETFHFNLITFFTRHRLRPNTLSITWRLHWPVRWFWHWWPRVLRPKPKANWSESWAENFRTRVLTKNCSRLLRYDQYINLYNIIHIENDFVYST